MSQFFPCLPSWCTVFTLLHTVHWTLDSNAWLAFKLRLGRYGRITKETKRSRLRDA